ncbi:Calpain-type cysteine protease dek1 [Trifolium repens]|nr:Calpain-type cysteine protease dek1 [Trifolium repens]
MPEEGNRGDEQSHAPLIFVAISRDFCRSLFGASNIIKLYIVLLSYPIMVYSPRVLPVYVYDAHADCGKNVSIAFLMLYGIALATEVSHPCLTLKMMEDAVHFLSKETVDQAIARSATKLHKRKGDGRGNLHAKA